MELFADFDLTITLALLVGVFICFAMEVVAPALAAFGAVAILMALGILTTDEVLGVFSNKATMTVAAMFVLSAALERTGVIDFLAKNIVKSAEKSQILTVAGVMGLVLFASMFVNNTSVVVIMTPVVIALAKSLKKSPSGFLLPLSYMSIFAGTCTLIGSSTNLIVDGVAQNKGMEAFGMFEITLPGLCLAGVGVLYMLLIGRHIIPDRKDPLMAMGEELEKVFFTEVVIPKDSPLVGKTIKEAGLTEEKGFDIVTIDRPTHIMRKDFPETEIKANDRIVLRTTQQELVSIKEKDSIVFNPKELRQIQSESTVLMEGIVGPHSHFVGKFIKDLNLRNRYKLNILAVHREQGIVKKEIGKVRLKFGDTILLEGPAAGIAKLFKSREILKLGEPEEKAFRRKLSPVALLGLLSVVGLAPFVDVPIAGLALIAAIAVILLGCLDLDDAYNSIEWQIIMLIFGMLGLSIAMEKTGAAQLIVDSILSLTQGYGPIVLISVIYLLTSIMTEFLSNNAAAIILSGIAIGLAEQMGVDPRPFAVAVMFGASSSFATPIGYQTNTFVYKAGGYKFSDFVKVGLPLNILLWITATIVIPMFWDITPQKVHF